MSLIYYSNARWRHHMEADYSIMIQFFKMAPYTRNNVYIVLIDGKKLPNRFSDNNFNNGDETCPTGLSNGTHN